MSKTKLITSAFITLQKVFDGSDGFTVTLSNPTHTILCDSNGEPMVGELGPNGKAKCVIKVHGSKPLTVTPDRPSKGQYAYYIRRELCENCEVIAPTPDSFYINTVGVEPTGKVVVDVNIEGTKTVRQEMTFIKIINPDINFGVDGKFIYGKNQWCADINNGSQLDNKVKVVKSNNAIYGKNLLEVVGNHWIFSRQPVKLEDNKIYRLKFRARQTKDPSKGTKRAYMGLTPWNSSNQSIGTDGAGNVYLWNDVLSNNWVEQVYYFAKEARPAITDMHGAIKFPSVRALPQGTTKFFPMFIVNYSDNTDGIAEVDCLVLEDATAEFETAEVKNKTVKLETDVNGINASVRTIKSITDKSDNPMTLRCKVNYSAFNTEDYGEIYLHGLNSNKTPADVDGVCRWMDQDVTLPKVMYNPNGFAPLKHVIFMVFDKNSRKWLMCWEEKSDTGTRTWKCLDAVVHDSNKTPSNLAWSEANHIVVGYFIISDKKEKSGEDYEILMAQMFKGALNYKQATTMSLSSSLSQIEVIEDNINMKVDKDGVVAAINIYAQQDGSGNTTSGVKIRGDKIDLQGRVTFNDLSADNETGLKKIFNHSNNSTTINGGFIDTKSIKADSIDLLSGLTVMGADNSPVFAISRVEGTNDKGTVEINGLLRSGNFSETLNTGYKISPDGTAILNQAIIRGDVQLPNAGITNYGATIGNENLLLNTDFSKTYKSSETTDKHGNIYADGWGGYNGGVSDPTHKFHAHINNTKFGFNVYEFNESTGVREWKGISQNAQQVKTIDPKKTYYISMDIYATDLKCSCFGGFYSKLTNNDTPSFHGGQYRVTPKIINAWHRVSAKVPVHANIKTNDSVSIYIYGYGFSSNCILYIKNVKLEEGENNTPWCPPVKEQGNSVRFWAGSSYENRNSAPFRVMQNGDVYARNGTYEGLLRGTLDSGDVQVYNNALTIHSAGTENEIIGLRAQQSFFKTDFVLGDKNVEYLNNQKTFTFNSARLIGRHKPTTKSGASFEFNPDGDFLNSFKITNPINDMNTSLSVGYLYGESNNTVMITHSGNKGIGSDIEFLREDFSEDINLKVNGNVIVRRAVKSNTNNIEIRSVANEGWGFFAIQ